MNTFRAAAIATTAVLIVTSGAYAQVRVITPDSEHVYSADPARPQQLPDDETLQLQNERAEKRKAVRDLEEDRQRRQGELDAEYARIRAEAGQAAANAWRARQNARIRDAGGQDNLAFGSRRNRY